MNGTRYCESFSTRGVHTAQITLGGTENKRSTTMFWFSVIFEGRILINKLLCSSITVVEEVTTPRGTHSSQSREGFTFSTPPGNQRTEGSQIPDGNPFDTMTVGVAIGAIVVVIGVGFYWTLWCARRRKCRKNLNEGGESIQIDEQTSNSRLISFTDVINGNICMPNVTEFNDLVSFQDDDIGQRLTRYQGKRFNKLGSLNLVRTVLPFDHNRVKLRNPIDGYDYVNASFISQDISEDSTYDEVLYSSTLSCSKIKIIVGQDPLPHTFKHHWSLVHENVLDFVVDFKKSPLKVGKVYRFGEISVRVLDQKKMSPFLSKTEIRLFNISAPGAQFMHNTKVYHFYGWPEESTIADDQINGIVSALVLLRNEIRVELDNAKIMIHDKEGGIGPAAVIATLLKLFETIDDSLTDKNEIKKSAEKLAIFDTVNKLRMDRANMVLNFETYTAIYQCVEHYGHQRLTLQKLRSDEILTKSASTSKVKIATPKMNIAQNIKTKNKQKEIGEEYVIHHDYVNDRDDSFDNIYDEYLIPDE